MSSASHKLYSSIDPFSSTYPFQDGGEVGLEPIPAVLG